MLKIYIVEDREKKIGNVIACYQNREDADKFVSQLGDSYKCAVVERNVL